MSFQVYAWITTFSYGLSTVLSKLITKYRFKNLWLVSFLMTFLSFSLTLILGIYNGIGFPNDWLNIIIASIFFALTGIFYIRSISSLDVSVLAPLFNFRVIFSVLLGYLLLGEVLTQNSYLIIALIVVAGLFASMDENFNIRSFFTKKIGTGMILMISLSFYGVFINRALKTTDFWTASVWVSGLVTLMIFAVSYSKIKDDLQKIEINKLSGIFGMAVLNMVGDLSANKAFAGNVGVSSVIISLPIPMVLAFLFSVFKPELLEKHPVKVYVVRFVAAGVMIWGALQLSR